MSLHVRLVEIQTLQTLNNLTSVIDGTWQTTVIIDLSYTYRSHVINEIVLVHCRKQPLYMFASCNVCHIPAQVAVTNTASQLFPLQTKSTISNISILKFDSLYIRLILGAKIWMPWKILLSLCYPVNCIDLEKIIKY